MATDRPEAAICPAAWKSGDEEWPDVVMALVDAYCGDPTPIRRAAIAAAIKAALREAP